MPDGKTHDHNYEGITSVFLGSRHDYIGETSANSNLSNHYHYIEGYTKISNGHSHHYKMKSSEPYYKKDGSHFHYYEGITDIVEDHYHTFRGYVSPVSE